MRRVLRGLSTAMIVAGVLLLADAGATLVWQEPVTAVMAKIRQGKLGDDLEKLEHAPPTAAEKRALDVIGEEEKRIAFRARAFRRRMDKGQAIGRIRIKKIGANYVMVQGTDAGSLRKGPGHYPGTPLPGLPGTVGIAGHRTTYLAPFNKLDKLKTGDEIELEMPYGTFKYAVERSQIVPPTALWVTRRVDHERIVLTACHPKYSAAKRIAVFAKLVSETERT